MTILAVVMELKLIFVFLGLALFSSRVRSECPPNTFGVDCHPCNCFFGLTCDPVTGECPENKCNPAYYGPTCTDRIPMFHSVKLCVLWMNKDAFSARFNQWEPSMGGTGPVEEYFIQRTLAGKDAWERRQSLIHVDGGQSQTVVLFVDPGVEYFFRIRPTVEYQRLGPPGPVISIKTQADLPEGRQEVPDDIKCDSINETRGTEEEGVAVEGSMACNGHIPVYFIAVAILATALVCTLVGCTVMMLYCRCKMQPRQEKKI